MEKNINILHFLSSKFHVFNLNRPIITGVRNILLTELASFDQTDVHHFLDSYFSTAQYRLSLLNSLDDNRNRYNLDGSPSAEKVSMDAIRYVAHSHLVRKQFDQLSPTAKTFVAELHYKKRQEQRQQRKLVKQLLTVGFSPDVIVQRLGKTSIRAIDKVSPIKPDQVQPEYLQEADQLRKHCTRLSLKDIKQLQRHLISQSLPLHVVLYATQYEHSLIDIALNKLSA